MESQLGLLGFSPVNNDRTFLMPGQTFTGKISQQAEVEIVFSKFLLLSRLLPSDNSLECQQRDARGQRCPQKGFSLTVFPLMPWLRVFP